MAFPTTGVIETFTGANNTTPPNANWTNMLNTLKIQSNACTGGTAGALNVGAWDTATFGAASEVFATISTVTNDEVSLAIRTTTLNIGTCDGYILDINLNDSPDTWDINEMLNGGWTTLATTTQNVASGEKIGLSAIGTALKAYYYTGGAWTEKLSTTDSTYGSAGYIGLCCYGTNLRIDDFGGGTFVSSSSSSQSSSKSSSSKSSSSKSSSSKSSSSISSSRSSSKSSSSSSQSSSKSSSSSSVSSSKSSSSSSQSSSSVSSSKSSSSKSSSSSSQSSSSVSSSKSSSSKSSSSKSSSSKSSSSKSSSSSSQSSSYDVFRYEFNDLERTRNFAEIRKSSSLIITRSRSFISNKRKTTFK